MVALGMLSTALKDLAVEMNLFVMSATQTNAKSEDNGEKIKNESVVRGARSIIDKCDIACVASRVTKEEEELLKEPIAQVGIIPNQVLDVYKVRRGRYTNVRIWSYMDLGNCRKRDLFVTDEKGREINNFDIIDFIFKESEDTQLPAIVSRLNSSGLQAPAPVKTIEEPVTEVIEEDTEVIIVEPPKISKKEMFDLSV